LKVKVQPRPQTIAQARAELSRRLEARREEIEAAVMTRVYSVSDTKDLDPTYAEGLKAAVAAAVDYGLVAIELGEERSSPPPPILLAQARMAARNGIGLDTVLRRYFAGHALLGDFLVEEAEGGRLLRGAALQKLLRTQAALFDRLIAAISEQHGMEFQELQLDSSARRRIEQLLNGELVDTTDLLYDFDGHHLGVVAQGVEAKDAISALAARLDRRLLCVQYDRDTLWVWLGGRGATEPEDLDRALTEIKLGRASLALGEQGHGLSGWRLSHRQARAALSIALRGLKPIVRYAEVALLASILQDDLVAESLYEIYLMPLEDKREGGETLRETLRAYFVAERNAASTAAALGVTRQTVNNRLRTAEHRLGRPLRACASELEAALRLDDLRPFPSGKTTRGSLVT
jgi:hypothetical protein